MIQGSPEWFAARAGKITASRVGDLMARTKSGPSTSHANLLALLAVERITGQCVETYTNAAMQRGTELEPEARAAYEAHAGLLCEEVGIVVHPKMSYVTCSPDGMVGDDGLLEIKCPQSMAKHLEALRSGSHAVEYRWQVQHQMMVTGRAWCDVVSYDPRWPEGLRLAITRVERDESAIEELQTACEQADRELQGMVAELNQLKRTTA